MDQYWSACEPIMVGAATNTGSYPYPPRGSTLLHKEAPPTEGLTAQDQRLQWEGQEGYLEVARAGGLRYLKGESAGGVTSS